MLSVVDFHAARLVAEEEARDAMKGARIKAREAKAVALSAVRRAEQATGTAKAEELARAEAAALAHLAAAEVELEHAAHARGMLQALGLLSSEHEQLLHDRLAGQGLRSSVALLGLLAVRHGDQEPLSIDEWQAHVAEWAQEFYEGLDLKDSKTKALLALGAEAGEVLGECERQGYRGADADSEAIARELGDVLFNVTVIAQLHGFGLANCMAAHRNKVRARQPFGPHGPLSPVRRFMATALDKLKALVVGKWGDDGQ